jgi:hypothetical protein
MQIERIISDNQRNATTRVEHQTSVDGDSLAEFLLAHKLLINFAMRLNTEHYRSNRPNSPRVKGQFLTGTRYASVLITLFLDTGGRLRFSAKRQRNGQSVKRRNISSASPFSSSGCRSQIYMRAYRIGSDDSLMEGVLSIILVIANSSSPSGLEDISDWLLSSAHSVSVGTIAPGTRISSVTMPHALPAVDKQRNRSRRP